MQTVPPRLTASQREQAYRRKLHDTLPAVASTELARSLVARAARAIPDLGPTADAFCLFADTDVAAHALRKRLAPIFDKLRALGHEALLDDYETAVLDSEWHGFIQRVNSSRAATVVFVAHEPAYPILRESFALRDHGWQTFLVSMVDMTEQAYADGFDGCLAGVHSASILAKLLRRLQPRVFHFQGWMFQHHLARVVIENKGAARCVCEFYDMTSILADRDDLCGLWKPEDVDLDLAMEAYICKNADAIIHRFPEDVFHEVMPADCSPTEELAFGAYPLRRFCTYRKERPSTRDGRIRLAYVGQLIPHDAAHPYAFYPVRTMDRLFRIWLEQGFLIHVFTPQNRPFHGDMHAYRDLALAYEHFHISGGLSPTVLASVLSGFDFGLALSEVQKDRLVYSSLMYRGASGAKVAGYLEAGLPLLVNEEFEAMANHVRKYDIGAAIHSCRLDALAQVLAPEDAARWRRNVIAHNEQHCMEREIERVLVLYSA